MSSALAPDVASLASWYRLHGYVHVPGVFTEELPRLIDALDAITLEQRPWRGTWLSPEEQAQPIALDVKHEIHRLSSVWGDALQTPDLLQVIEACLGQNAILDQSCVVNKPPAVGQRFPMHQDSAYYGPKDGRYVIVTVYLDDATRENGPIQFVDGSHLLGALAHTVEGKAYLPQYTLGDSIPVYAKAGDVTLFSINTIHGSGPNLSPAVRRTVRVGYRCA